MRQSRLMSLVEAVANVVVGYALAECAQVLVSPPFGLDATLRQILGIGAIFTLVSLARGYLLRRAFEAVRRWAPCWPRLCAGVAGVQRPILDISRRRTPTVRHTSPGDALSSPAGGEWAPPAGRTAPVLFFRQDGSRSVGRKMATTLG